MKLITKEILAEKLREKPNVRFIRRLQLIADKKKKLSFKDFDGLGRFEPSDAFIERDNLPSNTLHKDCTDVVRYLDKYYVQALKDNTYYVNLDGQEFRDKQLSSAVEFLWDNGVSKL